MIFSFASLISAVIVAPSFLAFAAPALPAVDAELENRANWNYRIIHNVTVGRNRELRFSPQYVHARVGDIVQFVL